MPSMAVDNSSGPFHDRIYATWTDEASGRARTMLSYSSDRGRTWSKPFAFDDSLKRRDPARGPDDFKPTVAVNTGGVVGVTGYDRRDNPDNIGYCVRFSASLDGGETFSPSVKVSDGCNQHLLDRLPMRAATDGGGSYSVPHRSDILTIDIGESPFGLNPGDTAGLATDSHGV